MYSTLFDVMKHPPYWHRRTKYNFQKVIRIIFYKINLSQSGKFTILISTMAWIIPLKIINEKF